MNVRKMVSMCVVLSLVTVAAPALAGPRHDWVLLGERIVTDRADHDVIAVTARRGDFVALKLKVFDRPVDFHAMTVHFANGDTQDVELRDSIRAGGESRVIDLQGGDRVIRSIEFRYDAKSLAGKSARIKVFGRH